jgi:uncharacterized protein (TIGR03435 family)
MIERIHLKITFIAGLLPIAAAWPAVPSLAQAAPQAAATPATAAAAAPPVFEVSTVKLNKTGSTGSSANFKDGYFTASNESLRNLMQYEAYGIPESRILGGPKWLNSERFDIAAKTDSSFSEQTRTLPRDQRRLLTQAMFQRLLADRFKLAVHWETRELPVYALVVAKKGPILHESKEINGNSGTSSTTGKLSVQNLTLAEIAQALTRELSTELGRVVIDKTGIQGRYDFTLKWTPDNGAAAADNGTGGTPPPADSGPSIFTAVQEQLGLKLESAKGQVQVLVIDHAEMPSEN